jgi:hypothetical protein
MKRRQTKFAGKAVYKPIDNIAVSRQIQVGKWHCHVLSLVNKRAKFAGKAVYKPIDNIAVSRQIQVGKRHCRVLYLVNNRVNFTGKAHIISQAKHTSFHQSRTRQCRVPTGFHRSRIKANRFHPSNKGRTPWPHRALH